MTAAEILTELKKLGHESTKKVLLKHGAREPFYGVKVEDIKKIQKRIKKDHALSLALYETGVSDAMYLAGLIADETKMTKKDIQKWAENAYWYMLSEYTVAWVASESPYGWELALKWIESKKENLASSGWATLSSIVAITPDEQLDIPCLKSLIERVGKTIHDQPNFVRRAMNGFLLAAACYVPALTNAALKAAGKVGEVSVDMGETACQIPYVPEYVEKFKKRSVIGKKRKSPRC